MRVGLFSNADLVVAGDISEERGEESSEGDARSCCCVPIGVPQVQATVALLPPLQLSVLPPKDFRCTEPRFQRLTWFGKILIL